MTRKSGHIVFIVTVCLMLILPAWNIAFRTLPDDSPHENRRLAAKPLLTISGLDTFPSSFDQWFDDHLPFRNALINMRMSVDINLLRQSPIPSYVIIGKEWWLYNTGQEIDIYRGTNLFSSHELTLMKNKLLERKKIIENKNAFMLYVTIPTKYSVYHEYLPMNIRKAKEENRTDQFVNCMKQAGIPLLDLRGDLIKGKNKGFQLYYKGDNHWNHHGAFIAYQSIVAYLDSVLPSVGPPLKRSDYHITARSYARGNLSDMLFLRQGCGDEKYSYKRIIPNTTHADTTRKYTVPKNVRFKENYEERYVNNNPRSPKIMIIRDSFGEPLVWFLKEHFSETVCIFDAWNYDLNMEILSKEKPDIVLFLVLESFTHTLL